MADSMDFIQEQLDGALKQIEGLERHLKHRRETNYYVDTVPFEHVALEALTAVARLHHGVIVRLDSKIR